MRNDLPPEHATPARVRDRPTWLISRAYARSQALLADAFADAGVRGHHYRLLAALDEFGPASQAGLGRRTGIDRSDVVAAVNELATRGLVERARDPDDGRRNVVSITRGGKDQLKKLDRVVAEAQEKLLAPLSASERQKLVPLLRKLVRRHG